MNAHGITLIEHLVALFLGSLVILVVYGFYGDQLFQSLAQEAKAGTLEDARGALDIIVRDLKNAGAWVAGVPPEETGMLDDPENDLDLQCNRIYAASPRAIHIQMDLNGNGTCADIEPRENIRYELTGPTSTCRGTTIIRRNGDCLVANVTTAATGQLFTFFNATGANMGGTPALKEITRIRIDFAVVTKHPNPRMNAIIVSQLSTSVNLRNRP